MKAFRQPWYLTNKEFRGILRHSEGRGACETSTLILDFRWFRSVLVRGEPTRGQWLESFRIRRALQGWR
jgi:hypothetical protein